MAIEPRLNKDRQAHGGLKPDIIWMVLFVGFFAAWFVMGVSIMGSTNMVPQGQAVPVVAQAYAVPATGV